MVFARPISLELERLDGGEVGSAPNAAQLAFFEAVYQKQRR
jgi:hypothetical protein